MRIPVLTKRFRREVDQLAPRGSPARAAVGLVLRELVDEREAIPRPDDPSVAIAMCVVGRVVAGTDLIVCYIPAGPEVHVIAVQRRPL